MITFAKVDHPFPGLRPFKTEESNLFFGREGQSDELLARLSRTRFLAVVGTSGSGKSSLVRAGLLPALYGGLMAGADSSWRVAMFRPGPDPLGGLARALCEARVPGTRAKDPEVRAALVETTLRRSSLGLVEAARQARLGPRESLLVVVDQFEELFRFKRVARDDDAAAFVKLLLEAAAQRDVPVYVVITMRSDFLGDCAQFRGLPEAINDAQYLIPRMSLDERREAIAGPVAVGGARITPRLVSRVLNDMGDNPDQLPIMQHALMRTWDFWATGLRNGAPLDLGHYDAVGTMERALSEHADEAFNELPEAGPARRTAELMFKALTEKGADNRETRRPTRLRELCAVTGAGEEEEVAAVVEVFRREGRSFLTPPEPAALTPETVVDISHESLIRNWGRLRGWVNEEAQSARVYRRLAEAALLHREEREGLLTDPRLEHDLEWRDRHRPTAAWAARYHEQFDLAAVFPAPADPAADFDPESRHARLFDLAMSFLDESRDARDAQLKKEREREQRELENTRAFAEQQARSARRLRWLSAALAVVVIIALALAAYANRKQAQARASAERARQKETEANTQRTRAESYAITVKQEFERAEAAKVEAEAARAQAETAKGEALEAQGRAEAAAARASQQARLASEREADAIRERNRAKELLLKDQLNTRGLTLMHSFAMEEAEATFKKLRDLYGDDREGLKGKAWASYNLGDLYRRLGRHEQAAELFDTALKMQGRAYGGDRQQTVGFLASLAQSFHDQKSYLAASERFEQLLAALHERPGSRDKYFKLTLANTHAALANVYSQMAQPSPAVVDAGGGDAPPVTRQRSRELAEKHTLDAVKIFEDALADDQEALATRYEEAAEFLGELEAEDARADISGRAEGLRARLALDAYGREATPAPSRPEDVQTLLPESGVGFTYYNREPGGADQYGRASTIQAVTEIARAWAEKHPDIPIQVGDISRRGGGRFYNAANPELSDHANHRDGREVDFRPMRKDGLSEPTSISSETYAHDLTRDLAVIIKEKFPDAIIIFNDPKLVHEGLTRRLSGHDNFLHVRFP